MKQNLDTLRTDIEAHLKQTGFVVFYAHSRGLEGDPEVDWDTQAHPDFREFVDAAKQLGIRMMVMHHRQFNSAILERTAGQMEAMELDYEDQRSLESRLNELKMFDGFTCAIELSFDYNSTVYMFELQTEWYAELNDILDELDLADIGDDDGEDETFGGYYSRN
jgi:hypothetical protein